MALLSKGFKGIARENNPLPTTRKKADWKMLCLSVMCTSKALWTLNKEADTAAKGMVAHGGESPEFSNTFCTPTCKFEQRHCGWAP